MIQPLILIVEDDPDIAHVLTAYFEREEFRTVSAADGKVALDHHLALQPDLVVLDVKLPGMNGFDVLMEIRRRGQTPVLMATSLDEDLDKLTALRMGADDYVIKPFNPSEVVARARAILRRVHRSEDTVRRHGALEVDERAHIACVSYDNRRIPLDLTLTEFRLLEHMIRDPMRAFSRSMLVDACMPDSDALNRTVDSHISNLRRKLSRAGLEGMLPNVRGIGYRLGAL